MKLTNRHYLGRFLLPALLVLASSTAWGSVEPAAEVTGRVANLNGEPLAFANVVVLGTRTGAMTDKEGNFRFEVPPGTYSAKVYYLGYESQESGFTVGSGELRTLLFSLAPVEVSECSLVVFTCGCSSNEARLDSPRTEMVSRTPRISRMLPPYPNPLTGPMNLRFSVAERTRTRLRVFDVQGRLVSEILDEVLDPGRYSRTWRGVNDAGRSAASGVYFVNFMSGETTQTMRVVVIR